MDNEKVIDIFNTLVEVNNNRIEDYQSASEETKETEMKHLFLNFKKTSEKCKKELVDEVRFWGGKPVAGTTILGNFFRVWLDVKLAFTKNDQKAILNHCEYGEDMVLKTYDKVLSNEHNEIDARQVAMIKNQYKLLKADHDTIQDMKEKLVANPS